MGGETEVVVGAERNKWGSVDGHLDRRFALNEGAGAEAMDGAKGLEVRKKLVGE